MDSKNPRSLVLLSLANNFRLSIFVKARLSIDLKIILKTKSLWDRPVLAGRATLHTVRLRFYLQILRFAHQVFDAVAGDLAF